MDFFWDGQGGLGQINEMHIEALSLIYRIFQLSFAGT